jgi:hypothetical protein
MGTCALGELAEGAEGDLALDDGALVLEGVDDEGQQLGDVRPHVLAAHDRQLAQGGQHARGHARVGVLELGQQRGEDGLDVGLDQPLRRADQVAQQPRALFLVTAVAAELYIPHTTAHDT